MKFGELLRETQPDLYISRRHDRWMKMNSNAHYTAEAVEFMQDQLSSPPRVRKGTVSASSINSCERKQQFTYLGMPQAIPVPRTSGIFHNGTFTHLRWQMAGLSEGWLSQAEVRVPENPWDLSGTADGLCDDGSLVEIKSINDNGFRSVAQFGAKADHQFQLGVYLLLMGLTQGRFIYENKNTQEYLEIPYTLNDEVAGEVIKQTQSIWAGIEAHELAEPLSKCEAKEGYLYQSCPYRQNCLKTRDWDHAVAQVHEYDSVTKEM